MKYYLLLIFLLFIFKGSAQELQYTIVENGEDKFYYSSKHDRNNRIFLNQSPQLVEKLRKIRLSKAENPKVQTFKFCFGQSEIDRIKNNKAIISVEFIIDQTGETVSAAVLNHAKNNYSLSENSINCILSTALKQTFKNKYVPTNLPENYLLRIRILFNFHQYCCRKN